MDKQITFSCDGGILAGSGITLNDLQEHFRYLHSIFKEKVVQIIPHRINNIGQLWMMHKMATELKKLEVVPGFQKHLKIYNKRQMNTNFLLQ